MEKFTFANAFLYFKNIKAEGRFFLPYLLTVYAFSIIGISIMYVLGRFLLPEAPLGSGVLNQSILSDSPATTVIFLLTGLTFLLIYWVITESMIQRRYIRGESFRFQFGRDELNLLGSGILLVLFALFITFFAALLFFMIGAVVVSSLNLLFDLSAEMTVYASFIGGVAFWLILVYVLTPYSAAFALTIRDKKVQLFYASTVMRGKVGRVFFCFVFYSIASFLIDSAINEGIMLAAYSGQMGKIFVFVGVALSVTTHAILRYIMAGPPALAVLNDPLNPTSPIAIENTF